MAVLGSLSVAIDARILAFKRIADAISRQGTEAEKAAADELAKIVEREQPNVTWQSAPQFTLSKTRRGVVLKVSRS